MQCTNVVTTYYNEQLKQDMEREERIQKGEITRAQANKEDEEWQEVSVGCCFCRKNDAVAARPTVLAVVAFSWANFLLGTH
jgi:hypothetical protein